jgi:hypothetical protein
MPVTRIWDQDNGAWLLVGGTSEHVVSNAEPLELVDGMLWTNPDEINVADPSRLPRGVIAKAYSGVEHSGIVNATTVLTGMSVTAPMVAGRVYRISAQSIANGETALALRRFGFRQDGATFGDQTLWSATGYFTAAAAHWFTTTAGNHTYDFYASSDGYTLRSYGRWMLIEDLGLA